MDVQWFMILSLLQFGKVICGCLSTVYRGVQGFGPECKYRCNCKTQACNSTTGECRDGCLAGWMGPSCQYRNLAQIMTTNRNTNNYPDANVAIDGDDDTCIQAAWSNAQQPLPKYWHGQLQDYTYIVGFVIKLKKANKGHFRGFSIEVGNYSVPLTTCYKHGDYSVEGPVMEIICRQPVVGNSVNISLAEGEGDLDLCEVEIYGGRLVSFNKQTVMESTLDLPGFWNSSYAVDGGHPRAGENQDNRTIRTCAATRHTENETKKWWKVHLINTYSILAIYFYGRNDGRYEEQFNRFILKVGPGSDSLQEVFKDTPENYTMYQPKSKNFSSPVYGSLVQVERENDEILVICELEIFADCPIDQCGWECNETCMCSSLTTGKHKIEGTCPYGCTGRWTAKTESENKCNIECDNKKYGYDCAKKCGNCLNKEACDHMTGECPRGCKTGYQGPKCNTGCNPGWYGRNCSSRCGYCDNITNCDKETGKCTRGCLSGWQGSLCKDGCNPGWYGYNCSSKCGYCDNITNCDKETGKCSKGCLSGWQGSFCEDPCKNGFYGVNCTRPCGKCSRGDACNKTTGYCQSCEPGYQMNNCIESCNPGWYGYNCSSKCGYCDNITNCDKETGNCTKGCLSGWQGTLCKDPCGRGFYGANCTRPCGKCSHGDACNKKTGYCQACEPGYQMNNCIESCPHGWYGHNCSSNCGYCDNIANCDKITGHCTSGCLSGWQGSFCKEPCANGTYGKNCTLRCGNCAGDGTCNITTGICHLGCAYGFSRMFCQEAGSSSHTSGVVIGVIILVSSVVAVVGILTFIKRKSIRKNDTNAKNQRTLGVLNDLQKNNASTSGGKPNGSGPDVDAVYNNTSNNTFHDDTSIAISDIRAVCRSAKRDPTFLFSQFQEILYGLNGDASEAQNVAYKPKNRYRELYPYNANRVLLPEIPGDPISTYINASYINGYDQYKKYIAAQGAIQATISDIWRMIWSENINIIVMLTNCVEAGKMKCELYWPEDGSLVYGTIRTELVSVEQYADFVVRTFKCKNVTSKESRTVVQFHYTAWPDKDVPDTALSIVQFWRKVREHNPVNKKTGTSPWLVHCSAGVGRTGTFIAMDVLYDQGKAEGKVNIKEGVYRLREQRLNMVQTKEQYVLLFNILAEILDPVGTVCKSEEFSDAYRKLISNKATNKQKLFLEYQHVCKATDEFFQDQNEDGLSTACKHPENIRKSRNPRIVIQEERDRPRLCTPVQGCNDFINAVYLPTYRSRDHLILTQCPLENTVVDFIRMVWDCSVTDVVYLEEKLPRDGEAYWPINKKEKELGPFKAELVSEQTTENYTCRKIRFTLSANKQTKEIRQYHFHHWPQKNETPVDTASMLRLVSAVDEQFRKEDNSRLVIQCLDGAKSSGLFCVVYSVLERLKMDREVAVAETVILARIKRKQIIDNFEQYKYCHDVVEEHLQSSNVYVNLA